MIRLSSLSFTILCICGLFACSPTKGYQGPDLPENQVGLIQYSENGMDGSVSVENARSDAYTFSGAGITVLPGKHTVELNIQVKAQALGYNCHAEPSFDDYGFQECVRKRRQDNNFQPCDCFDYLSIYKVCQVEVANGSCNGELITNAGGKYMIDVRKNGMRADVHCLSCGLGGPVTFTCTDFLSSFVEDRDYVGTGRSNAYSAGVYSCGYY